MTLHYCDSCKRKFEPGNEPIILKVESLHKKAQVRNDLMLCGDCERQIHFAIHNLILTTIEKPQPIKVELLP